MFVVCGVGKQGEATGAQARAPSAEPVIHANPAAKPDVTCRVCWVTASPATGRSRVSAKPTTLTLRRQVECDDCDAMVAGRAQQAAHGAWRRSVRLKWGAVASPGGSARSRRVSPAGDIMPCRSDEVARASLGFLMPQSWPGEASRPCFAFPTPNCSGEFLDGITRSARHAGNREYHWSEMMWSGWRGVREVLS